MAQWSLAEILEARKASQEAATGAFVMPDDVIPLTDPECPPQARLWPLRAGISLEVASDVLGMRWSDKLLRVLLPVREGAAIGRSVLPGINPKYLAYGFHGTEWYWIKSGNDTCVVVEDMLSAYKVSRAGYDAVAALGTNVAPTEAFPLAEYTHVIGWFDSDAAGTKAWKMLRKAMGLFPVSPKRAITKDLRDPKLIPVDVIRDIVEKSK